MSGKKKEQAYSTMNMDSKYAQNITMAKCGRKNAVIHKLKCSIVCLCTKRIVFDNKLIKTAWNIRIV